MTVIDLVAVAVPQLLVTEYVIVAAPAATPVTTPVLLTVATAGEELLHAPPLTDAVSAVVAPVFTELAPETVPAEGVELTVTTFVATVEPDV